MNALHLPRPRPWRAPLWVLAFDRLVQRFYHVEEFSNDPRCIFKITWHEAGVERVLADGSRIEPHARVVELHFWNERLPRKDPNNPLPWRQRMVDAIGFSLQLLGRYLASVPHGENVVAAYGVMSLWRPERFAPLLSDMGVEFMPHVPRTPLQHVVQCLDHLYARLLARAVNPGRTAHLRVKDLQRVEVWVPRTALLQAARRST